MRTRITTAAQRKAWTAYGKNWFGPRVNRKKAGAKATEVIRQKKVKITLPTIKA